MLDSKSQEAVTEMLDFISPYKITHLYPKNESIKGNQLNINNIKSINFGSCSYLGYEFEDELIDGATEAIKNFGTQFSISRAYLSCPLYSTLEEELGKIIDYPFVVTPTTTLGHIATIPTIISEKDAVILDHQVHSSVQTAVQLLKSAGVTVQMIRHSRMDQLEARVLKLRDKYEKIWYMADGIYSMYGDKAPLDDIYMLMDKYPELHLYIDDAHGMSCYGEKGEGYVLSHSKLNSRTIVTLSMAKGYGSGGAVFVFPSKEMARNVSCTGLPMITSGPIQPAVLGACINSARLHNSIKFKSHQTELKENIKYTNTLLKKFSLPLLHNNDSPIFFIGAGLPIVGRNLVKRLMNQGLYINIGIFPAVPVKNTGIRFTITRLHTFEQIEQLVETLAHHYPLALAEENVTLDQVCKNFDLNIEDYTKIETIDSLMEFSKIKVEQFESISDIDHKKWDGLFEFNAQLNSDQMEILEDVYSENELKENNWDFNYLKITDAEGKVIIAAPFITLLQKDDLLHPEEISQNIELYRKAGDPYYLTSKVLMMGSPIALGQSMYIDEKSPLLAQAFEKFTSCIDKIKSKTNAESVMLRDFYQLNTDIKKKFEEAGYFKMETFKTNTIYNLPNTMEEHKNTLSKNSKRHIKRKAEKFAHKFDYLIIENPNKEQIKEWYQLYLNVSVQKSEINAFKLPLQLFERLISSKFWEIHILNTKENENLGQEKQTVGVLFMHKNKDILTPNYIGMDYNYSEFHIYQQMMYKVVEFAIDQGYERVDLGITADFEKGRIGATLEQLYALVQVDDHYNHSHIDAVHNGNNEKKLTPA